MFNINFNLIATARAVPTVQYKFPSAQITTPHSTFQTPNFSLFQRATKCVGAIFENIMTKGTF